MPPLALLAYAADEPKVAAFWPFAVFSPSGRRWSGRSSTASRCGSATCRPRRCWLRRVRRDPVRRGGRTGSPDRDDPARDPLGALAAAAGYDDPERWWEDLVESRLDGSSPFPLLVEAMAELRGGAPARPSPTERRREAYMRQTIRARADGGAGSGSRWSAAPGTPRR